MGSTFVPAVSLTICGAILGGSAANSERRLDGHRTGAALRGRCYRHRLDPPRVPAFSPERRLDLLLAVSASLVMTLLPWNRISNRLLIVFPLVDPWSRTRGAHRPALPGKLTAGLLGTLFRLYPVLTQPRGTATRFTVIVTPVPIYPQHESLVHSLVQHNT